MCTAWILVRQCFYEGHMTVQTKHFWFYYVSYTCFLSLIWITSWVILTANWSHLGSKTCHETGVWSFLGSMSKKFDLTDVYQRMASLGACPAALAAKDGLHLATVSPRTVNGMQQSVLFQRVWAPMCFIWVRSGNNIFDLKEVGSSFFCRLNKNIFYISRGLRHQIFHFNVMFHFKGAWP